MRRRLAALASITLAFLALAPVDAWSEGRPTGGHLGHGIGHGLGTPRPHHRPSRPIARPHPVVGCCLGGVYVPPAPPVVVIPPPPVYVIVPSPPSLVYVPTPRVEPAPEVTLPTGRWARHGNGVDYPYVWVWAGPAAAR